MEKLQSLEEIRELIAQGSAVWDADHTLDDVFDEPSEMATRYDLGVR